MTPADGSGGAPPAKVVLAFNEPVGTTAPGAGDAYRQERGQRLGVIDNTVTQPVGAMVEASQYQVDARIVSDGSYPMP
jgi:hypothetical protein